MIVLIVAVFVFLRRQRSSLQKEEGELKIMIEQEAQKREEHEDWMRERQEKKREEHGQQILDENKAARRSAFKSVRSERRRSSLPAIVEVSFSGRPAELLGSSKVVAEDNERGFELADTRDVRN